MERSFFLDFLDNTHRFFHIDMERIYVVVPIGHARNNTVTFAVHTSETSRKPFGRSSQNRVIEIVAGLVLLDNIVHHPYGIIECVPCLLVMSMAFAVNSTHRIVPANEPDTQCPAIDDIAHLVVGL